MKYLRKTKFVYVEMPPVFAKKVMEVMVDEDFMIRYPIRMKRKPGEV